MAKTEKPSISCSINNRTASPTNRATNKRATPRSKADLIVNIISWFAVAAWIAFIIYMSSRSSESLETDGDEIGFLSVIIHNFFDSIFGKDVNMGDIVAHTAEYTVLGVLVANALRFHMPLKWSFLVAWAFCVLFAFSDEFHQLLADQGRAFQLIDLCCDTLGAGIGSFVLTRFRCLARH